MQPIDGFIKEQLAVWPEASGNFKALENAMVRTIRVFGLDCRVQHNPKRLASTTAETDPASIAARPCFLCVSNRPKEQFHFIFEASEGRCYNVQVNPFPIFPGHLVIAGDRHVPQCIWPHFRDMLAFAGTYPDYTVFYNGPASGASAPDHLHFQGAPRGLMPLECAADGFFAHAGVPLAAEGEASIHRLEGFTHGVYVLRGRDAASVSALFRRLLDCCGSRPDGSEVPCNVFAWNRGGEYRVAVVLRRSCRSHHYYAEGAEHLSMSPGAADVAGVLVAPFREDFDKLDSELLEDMLSEVNITMDEERLIDARLSSAGKLIEVGLLRAKRIRFELMEGGPQEVSWSGGRILYKGNLYDELLFEAPHRKALFDEPAFVLQDVVIGINFHWEQKRTLKYAGGLKFIVDGDSLVAVNLIGLENYLLSVISSEMKSSSSLELLKAHAVISRSWVLTNLRVHGIFDVCADDHCQRYQGLTMAVGENVRKAIEQTWGQVLKYDGQICDARYAKCCGGRTERFSACWEDVDFPYLTPVDDVPEGGGKPFCDCENAGVLSQVLNDYDMATRDFYRWRVRYRPSELSELVARKSGLDLGRIETLEPLERGDSGRIFRLRVVGDKGEAVFGKELEIRRMLSESHLKSSAFEVSREGEDFILDGKGWGHGVGLCQIGAAVMASEGYGYREILSHYYRGSEVARYE